MKRMNEYFETPITGIAFRGLYQAHLFDAEVDDVVANAINNADSLADALEEALLQIEYLHRKFGKTGSGNSVISRGDAALNAYRGAK